MALVKELQPQGVTTNVLPDLPAESGMQAGHGETRVSDEELTAIAMATIYGWGGTARLDDSRQPTGGTRDQPMGCRLRASTQLVPPHYPR